LGIEVAYADAIGIRTRGATSDLEVFDLTQRNPPREGRLAIFEAS
jgi:hypothetical protein